MGKRIEFTEEQLEEIALMYRYGYSAPEIAEWFGVSHSTIYRRLREMDVKIRRRGGTYIEREIPDPWLNADAAYVFGVLIGDASISSLKKVVLNTPDREFVATFSDAVESAFGIQPSRRPEKSENHVTVRACSVDLARSYDRFRWRTENWRVPEEFLDAPEEVGIALCQGKFDSDGGVQGKSMALGNIHRPGLEDMLKIVRGLGVEGKINGPEPRKGNRKDRHWLRIPECPPNLVRLPRKRKALEKVHG